MLNGLRHISGALYSNIVAVAFVMIFSFFGIMVRLDADSNPTLYLFQMANEQKSVGSLLMVFITLGAASLFNVVRHLIMRSNQVHLARGLYLGAILPLTGMLACLQVTHFNFWARSLDSRLSDLSLANAKLYSLASVFAILLLEIFVVVRSEIASSLQQVSQE